MRSGTNDAVNGHSNARALWAPAIVHFVAQGAVKVIVISGERAGLVPLLVYAFPVLIRLINRKPVVDFAVRQTTNP